ncbi:F-box protein PP2-B15 [Striga hermonthica]|uniref:F-box protein PP2-B15 n=1 Tax=Striga hermonthica TaxID=68872 RepID=A0A9N7MV33_STRHE|nr:F-box protein PP2-B15 [Striga hermonthica]
MIEDLPEECLCHIISFTSPADTYRLAAASPAFRGAADSDLTWETFLPPGYREILLRSVIPVPFSSKKDLFRLLSSAPVLLDEGKMTFAIDKSTNKKCYMLSARELSIAWSSNEMCWSWKHLLNSRFSEAAELIMVCWLEIHGKINTTMLSPKTTYGVYIVIQLTNRAFGLDKLPVEVSLELDNYKTKNTIYLKREEHNEDVVGLEPQVVKENVAVRERGDTWFEVELGEFYNADDRNKEVRVWLRETKGVHLKGGLVVEGIEVRPKHK